MWWRAGGQLRQLHRLGDRLRLVERPFGFPRGRPVTRSAASHAVLGTFGPATRERAAAGSRRARRAGGTEIEA